MGRERWGREIKEEFPAEQFNFLTLFTDIVMSQALLYALQIYKFSSP